MVNHPNRSKKTWVFRQFERIKSLNERVASLHGQRDAIIEEVLKKSAYVNYQEMERAYGEFERLTRNQ